VLVRVRIRLLCNNMANVEAKELNDKGGEKRFRVSQRNKNTPGIVLMLSLVSKFCRSHSEHQDRFHSKKI
jgi:hypothetical protein